KCLEFAGNITAGEVCWDHRNATVSSPNFVYDNVVGFNSGQCFIPGPTAVNRLLLISTNSPQLDSNLPIGISCDRDFGTLYGFDYPSQRYRRPATHQALAVSSRLISTMISVMRCSFLRISSASC